MQDGRWSVHRELLALVGMAEGILLVAGADMVAVAVAVNSEQMGVVYHLEQVHIELEAGVRSSILSPTEGVGIHRSLAAAVAVAAVVVDLGGTWAEVRHNNHLLPCLFLLPLSHFVGKSRKLTLMEQKDELLCC